MEFLSALEELEIYLIPLYPLLCSAGIEYPNIVIEACIGVIKTCTGAIALRNLTIRALLFGKIKIESIEFNDIQLKHCFKFFTVEAGKQPGVYRQDYMTRIPNDPMTHLTVL